MILYSSNQFCETEKGIFAPGDIVKISEKDVIFAGLYGVIKEIRTEEDKLTQSKTEEIYVKISEPELLITKKMFAKKYLDFCGHEFDFKSADNNIRYSPEDLCVIPEEEFCIASYAVVIQTSRNFPFDITKKQTVFGQLKSAERYFKELFLNDYKKLFIEDEVTIKSFTEWVKNSNVQFSDKYFSASDSNGNFIVASVEEVNCKYGSEVITLSEQYNNSNYCTDIRGKVKEKYENGQLPDYLFDYISANPEPNVFSNGLSKNDGYFESFWTSVDIHIDELAEKYECYEDEYYETEKSGKPFKCPELYK